MISKQEDQRAAQGVAGLVSSIVGLALGWIGYSAVGIDHHLPLAPAIEAERCSNWSAQRITPTRGLPHFERVAYTAHAFNHFWAAQQPF